MTRRRTLLTGAGIAITSALAGCTGGTSGGAGDEGRRYQTCSREVIPYEQFPDDVQAEIDAALDGGHETDRVYLGEAMDTERSYVEVGTAFYDPSVSETDGGERLTLRPVEPKALPDPRPVRATHDRDGEWTVSVELVADDGTVLVDATEDIWGGEVELGSTARVGTHDLHLAVSDGETVVTDLTTSVAIDQSRFSVLVVANEEVRIGGAVADLGRCRYDS